MVWLIGQVWVLCVLAFLLGALATWLAFVRPARRAAGPATLGGQRWSPPAPWAVQDVRPEPVRRDPERAPRPPPGPAVDSALAGLDTSPGPDTPRRGTGTVATSALDRLGVAGPRSRPADGGPDRARAPGIPRQAGPPDGREPGASGRRTGG